MSSVVVLPEVFLKNANKEEQKELVDFFDKLVKSSTEATIVIVEEKFERRLAEEIAKLDKKISETKAELIKWMFIFWAGQIIVLVAVLSLFFK
jgi:ribosomal protein S6